MRKLLRRSWLSGPLLVAAVVGAAYLVVPDNGNEAVNDLNYQKVEAWLISDQLTRKKLDALLGPPSCVTLGYGSFGMQLDVRIYVGKEDPQVEYLRPVITAEFFEENGKVHEIGLSHEFTRQREVLNWIKRKLGLR